MTRKKSSAYKPNSYRQKPLDKSFSCLQCHIDNAISCKLDFKTKIGVLNCKYCDIIYKTPIFDNWKEVDVYHVWLDENETDKQDVSE
eukprot:GAHX01002272.1.p1 GENE.GAHX01002272.1~~GAHX01002272.1.p1  ORF type:complete len:87 (-),score=14.01 GAHX01002272.1:100-360(-)